MEKKKWVALGSMALAGLCAVLWLYIAMFRWPEGERLPALTVAVMWLVVCVAWGLRVRKANNNKEEEA